MRPALLCALLVAAFLGACRDSSVSEDDIRSTIDGFFTALTKDPPKAYTYLAASCKEQLDFLDFAGGVYFFAEILGESELEVRNVGITERGDDEVTADFEVVIVADGEDIPFQQQDQGPERFVKEEGRWRFADCEAFGSEDASGEAFATAEPLVETPSRFDQAVLVEGDGDPSLPGEFVDLQSIYGGHYGNDDGPNTAAHVRQQVDYSAQGLPPAGGPHWGSGACGPDPSEAPPYCGPVPWGIYREPWETESLVHNMEHAGVVIWYNTADQAVIDGIEAFANDNDDKLLVVAPYPDMEPETVAITVWSRRDAFAASEYSPERLQAFMDALYCRFDPEGFCRR
jgi:hypothetical protein